MTIARKLMGAALLAGSAILSNAPAYAQPVPAPANAGTARLNAIMAEAAQAHANAMSASARCDNASLDAARATLARLEAETKRTAKAAKDVGPFSQIDPAQAEAVHQAVTNLHAVAKALPLQNCGAPRQTSETPAVTSPPAEGVTTAEEAAVDVQQSRIDAIEDILRAAEAARARGECVDDVAVPFGASPLGLMWARAAIQTASSGESGVRYPPELVESWKRRLAELEEYQRNRKDCGPAKPQPPATRPAGVPVDSVQVTDAAEAGYYYIPGTDTRLRVSGSVAWADVPQAGIGVQRDGMSGPESFAALTDDAVTKYGGEIEFDMPLGQRLGLAFSGGYMEGSSRSQFDIPVDGLDLGLVYGELSPSGSSGIIQPFFGLSGFTDIDVQQAHLDGCGRWSIFGDGDDIAKAKMFEMYGGVCASYRYSRFRYDMTAGFSGSLGGTLFESSQRREQRISNNMYGLGLEFGTRLPMADGISLDLSGRTDFYRLNSDLRSIETNLSNFGPMEDRDFSVSINESISEWGWRPSAKIGLNFNLSPTVGLRLGGEYEYYSKVGSVWNPYSGDQVFLEGRRTEIDTESFSEWTVSASVSVRFGARLPPP